MAKILFVLVFAIAVAMPLRTVLGQGGWQDLMGQGDLGQGDLAETLDEAKKAIGAASTAAAGQAAFNDYFGGGDSGGDVGSAADGIPVDGSASLADWIDENATNAEAGAPPLPVDSPIGQPEDLPAPTPEGSATDVDDSFAPGQAPSNEPKVIPEAPEDDSEPKVIPEAPEDDDSDVDDAKTPASILLGSPTDAPDGAPSDDDEDAGSPYGAPSFAPEGASGIDFDDDN